MAQARPQTPSKRMRKVRHSLRGRNCSSGGTGGRLREIGRFEQLEPRAMLSGGMIQLGPSDNIALDQPRVAMELLTSTGAGVYRYDFGTAGSEVQQDFTRATDADFVVPTGAVVTSAKYTMGSALHHDLVSLTEGTFSLAVDNGTYEVRVHFGDLLNAHDQMAVWFEGEAFSAHPLVDTAAGQVVVKSYTVSVTDGQLDVHFRDMGGSDARVAVVALEAFEPNDWGSVGPSYFNTFLLDTGANSVLAMASAVSDMTASPAEGGTIYPYVTEGTLLEVGVAGAHPLDISAPYRLDFAGTSGQRNTILDARIMSDADNDFSMFGPWGLVGMPAMVDRVTSLDLSVWSAGGSLEDLFMRVDFTDDLPAVRSDPANGDRYSVAVDNRIAFDPMDQTDDIPPVWGDVPFLTVVPTHNGVGREGNFLFDTGAQMSVISERLAFDLGLDANGNGDLSDEAQWFETVGGVGGTVTAPVLYIDELRVRTNEGVDLVWTDLLWLALDISLAQDTGQHDGANDAAVLRDLGKSWTVDEFVGMKLVNVDDGSEGVITANTADTITAILTGGAENRWDFGDEYEIVSVTLDGVFGSDLLTSGWVGAYFNGEADGFFQQIHFDFREMDTAGTGTLYFDLSEGRDTVIPPGPGVRIIETLGSTEVAEGGAGDEYRIVLTSAPQAGTTVTVNLALSDNQITAGEEITGSSSLTFDSSNWQVPRVVLIDAVDDNVAEPFHTSVITHQIVSDDTEYQAIAGSDLRVAVTDNDTPLLEIVHTGGSTDVTEGGAGDTFTIRAPEPYPTGSLTVVFPTNGTQVTVAPQDPNDIFWQLYGRLFFLTGDGNTPQTVVVNAVDDNLSEGPHTVEFLLEITDGNYNVIGQQIVRINITDNDPWVSVNESGGSTRVREATPATTADIDSYTLVLDKQPAADVVITASPDLQVDLGAGAGAPVDFTFTTANWNVPQTVTVTAVDDQLAELAHPGRITHTVASADAGYNLLPLRDVVVDIEDNDVADVSEPVGGITVSEQGGSETYSVVLPSQPTADVTIFLRNPDGQILAVDDANPANDFLNFDAEPGGPHPWNVPQLVRVTAIDDGIAEGEVESVIIHEAFSTDPRYQGTQSVMVTVMDTALANATVVDRRIFYNNSAFDTISDDGAIAPSPSEASDPALGKTALLPGETATFQNYTSYSKGINGIMIDVHGLENPEAIDASAFIFRVGNDDKPYGDDLESPADDWSLAPAPLAGASGVSVRTGEGLNGSDRITIIWPDNTIQKQWLQVTVVANGDTGLVEPDVFYWGNAIGECGNSPSDAQVNASDQLGARAHPRNAFFNPAPLEDPYDYNRDKGVNASDQLIARSNGTNFFTALKLIVAPELALAPAALSLEGDSAPDNEADTSSMFADPAASIANLESGNHRNARLFGSGVVDAHAADAKIDEASRSTIYGRPNGGAKPSQIFEAIPAIEKVVRLVEKTAAKRSVFQPSIPGGSDLRAVLTDCVINELLGSKMDATVTRTAIGGAFADFGN